MLIFKEIVWRRCVLCNNRQYYEHEGRQKYGWHIVCGIAIILSLNAWRITDFRGTCGLNNTNAVFKNDEVTVKWMDVACFVRLL